MSVRGTEGKNFQKVKSLTAQGDGFYIAFALCCT